MSYIDDMQRGISDAIAALDTRAINSLVDGVARVKDGGGRLFILGAGGSAAIASHAVIDLRKGCGVDAQAPTDGVEELTARTNDDGWRSVFAGYLAVSHVGPADGLLIFSLGGGDAVKGTSLNIIDAVDLAKSAGAAVYGVIGNANGHTALNADACVLLPGTTGPINLAVMSAVQKIVTTHPSLAA